MVAWGATVKNSPNTAWLHAGIMGGSVLYAPLACGSVRIDDLAAVGIMAACAPLPLC
jgi:Na+/serine symporter